MHNRHNNQNQIDVFLAVAVKAFHLKIHAQNSVSASTQNRHFQDDIIKDLWGILS